MNQDLPKFAASSYASESFSFVGENGPESILKTNTLAKVGKSVPQAFIDHIIKENDIVSRRMVQVFVSDPNENVPLSNALLYRGDQHLTDATDQELFFEIDINSILKTHNEARIKIVDKKVKDRTEYLEPAKIRDLKMVVVTIATF